MAQVKERQADDTTFYKTLIPETKQSLLKNVSMIANMRFAERNEFVDGDYTKSRFMNEQFRLDSKEKYMIKCISVFVTVIQGTDFGIS
jgi:hypothetical protein